MKNWKVVILEKVFDIARFIPINKNQPYPEEVYKIYLNSNKDLKE